MWHFCIVVPWHLKRIDQIIEHYQFFRGNVILSSLTFNNFCVFIKVSVPEILLPVDDHNSVLYFGSFWTLHTDSRHV